MSALQKFKTFFSKNVLLCLTVPMVVFSLLVPQPFVWMGQNISIDLSGIPFLKENFPSFGFVNMLLCVIMFGMGMTLKADDFKYIFKKPTDVLIGICSQYVFMAGFGWLVASLLSLTGVGDPTVRAQIAVGLVLLGCVPGGTASNVMTFLAKGDVALSITITMCTTLLAPVLTPSLTLMLAGQWIDVNFWNMFISIVLVVLAVQLKLEAAQSVDLVNGNLCRAGNAGAVNGSAAGQGADEAHFDGFLGKRLGRSAEERGGETGYGSLSEKFRSEHPEILLLLYGGARAMPFDI